MAQRPRFIQLGALQPELSHLLQECSEHLDTLSIDDDSEALRLLSEDDTQGILTDPATHSFHDQLRRLIQSEQVLNVLTDGVAIVDVQMRVLWANRTFQSWSDRPVPGRQVHEILGCPNELSKQQSPFRRALKNQAAYTCFQSMNQRYYELHVSPMIQDNGEIGQLLTLCRDVTEEQNRQRRLEALHQISRELAPLEPDQLSEMSAKERIELLKHNVREMLRDLLNYDVIELRLLDPGTLRLDPLISEGMFVESSDRRLLAKEEDNGISGYVACTGRSYLCPDTSADPRYVEGAPGARSSLTVPLIYQEEVIGTLNVESPQLDAFSLEDVQFVETFSRELATALHTLELLTVEKQTATAKAIDAVTREVALPVDEILAASAFVLDKCVEHDGELAEKLRKILDNARAIKRSIQKVGQDLSTPSMNRKPHRPDAELFEGMRVLVVDNDERVRRSAHGLLGRWGCVVETASTGIEAVTMARLSTYDMVLSDIRLPDIPGYEVYCQLRETQPQARVILMTSYGYDPSHTLVRARQDGLKHILYKPFRTDQLRAALTDHPE